MIEIAVGIKDVESLYVTGEIWSMSTDTCNIRVGDQHERFYAELEVPTDRVYDARFEDLDPADDPPEIRLGDKVSLKLI